MLFEVYFLSMNIRDAKIGDVAKIHELINSYAEVDRMLFASMANIYENLQIFKVAEADGGVVGCCALKVPWKDLAEIKSLAVDHSPNSAKASAGHWSKDAWRRHGHWV